MTTGAHNPPASLPEMEKPCGERSYLAKQPGGSLLPRLSGNSANPLEPPGFQKWHSGRLACFHVADRPLRTA